MGGESSGVGALAALQHGVIRRRINMAMLLRSCTGGRFPVGGRAAAVRGMRWQIKSESYAELGLLLLHRPNFPCARRHDMQLSRRQALRPGYCRSWTRWKMNPCDNVVVCC